MPQVGVGVELVDPGLHGGAHLVLGDARRTVQDQRDARRLLDLPDPLDVEWLGGGQGHTVHDADRDGEEVDTGLLHEALRLRDVGVAGLPVDLLVGVRDLPELGLDRDAELVGDLDHLLRRPDVLVERQVRAVIHE